MLNEKMSNALGLVCYEGSDIILSCDLRHLHFHVIFFFVADTTRANLITPTVKIRTNNFSNKTFYFSFNLTLWLSFIYQYLYMQ